MPTRRQSVCLVAGHVGLEASDSPVGFTPRVRVLVDILDSGEALWGSSFELSITDTTADGKIDDRVLTVEFVADPALPRIFPGGNDVLEKLGADFGGCADRITKVDLLVTGNEKDLQTGIGNKEHILTTLGGVESSAVGLGIHGELGMTPRPCSVFALLCVHVFHLSVQKLARSLGVDCH